MELAATVGPGDARRLAEQAVADRLDVVTVFGGDGTTDAGRRRTGRYRRGARRRSRRHRQPARGQPANPDPSGSGGEGAGSRYGASARPGARGAE